MISEQSVDCGPSAGKGHVEKIESGVVLELVESDLVPSARTRTGECQLARACAHGLHQTREGAVGRGRGHGKHARRADEITDWIKAGEWIKAQLAQMRPDQKKW